MNPLVSIVVPTFNGGRSLRRLLASIAEQRSDVSREVIAVDSGSTDDTLDILCDSGARVESVAPETFNHGGTRNTALSRARGEFAVLTVQDAVPANREWLGELLQPLLRDTRIAGTYARQKPWPEASRLTAHYLAKWAAATAEPRLVGPLRPTAFDAMSPADRHFTCAFDNVCSCIRMSVWHAHPFKRTSIAEDLEWAKEVLTSGYRLAYVPSALVSHSHERTVRYELERTYLVHQRLQSLFGLSTVPDIPSLVRAICSTLPLHLRLAAAEGDRHGRAMARAAGLAVAWPLGQYLGARSAREGRELLQTRGV
ncbi:MAG: glycosyltransferase [Vicinamibacterales bacterium]